MKSAPRDCPHLPSCPMFALFNLQASLQVWKLRYCTSGYEECERHRRSVAGREIPMNLMPSGVLLRRANP